MFFFTYNTDAPIYHYPIGTVGLVVANTLVFFLCAAGNIDEETALSLTLEFQAINPMQWLTNNFMHADFFHLLGNMFFLWAFGLIVEGKLGWYRFVPIYLAIGILYGAMIQLIMLGSAGLALGASGILFGLMGMAMVWAPKNDMHCIFVLIIFVFVRTFFFNVSVLAFGGLFLGLQLVGFWLAGYGMSSAALHLAGFVIGFPIGLVFLKLNWVDCEGWDLINVWQGKHKRDAIQLREERDALLEKASAPKQISEDEKAGALQLMREHLAEDRPQVALAIYKKTAGEEGRDWLPPKQDLLSLLNGLMKAKLWSDALPLMVTFVREFPEDAAPVRLKLAQIVLQIENRPRQALAVLAKLSGSLPPEMQQRRTQIAELCQREIDEGNLEMAVEDW